MQIQIDLNPLVLKEYNQSIALLYEMGQSDSEITQSIEVEHSGTMDEFFQDYKTILYQHDLGLHAGQILYLTAIIRDEIKIANENLNDSYEANEILAFLVELYRMKEKSNKPIIIDFKRKLPKGHATLKNQRIVDLTISNLVKALKRPDFNPILSLMLEDVTLTRANLTRLLLKFQHRYQNPTNFCLAQGCYNLLRYLKEKTTFKGSEKIFMTNDQARFIFDMLYLTKPSEMSDEADYTPVDFVRLLIKNHKKYLNF